MNIGFYSWSFSNTALIHKLQMADEYCRVNGLTIKRSYCDFGKRRKATAKEDYNRAERLGLPAKKGRRMLPQWENLMIDITENKIDTILVCNKIELSSSVESAKALERICNEYGITVIEIEPIPPDSTTMLCKRAIIYHSSSVSARPVIAIKDIDDMINYAASRNWEVASIYADTNLYSHTMLCQAICTANAGILIFKCVKHISRHTELAVSLLRKASSKGMRIISMNEGELLFHDNIIAIPMNAIPIIKHSNERAEQISNKKMEVFVKIKTKWTISNVTYSNAFETRNIPGVLLVERISDIYEDSVELIAFLKRSIRPLFSIKEGCIEVKNEE